MTSPMDTHEGLLELAHSIEAGHVRVVHLDANTQWAPYKTDVVVSALRTVAQAVGNRGALLDLLAKAYNEGFGEGMRDSDSSKGGWPWSSRKQKYSALLDKALSSPPSPELPAGGVMAAAERASKRVSEWSDAKKDYADRVTGALPAPAPHTEVREALEDAAEWCIVQGTEIGAIDGYDYRSGEEYGLRRASIELARRAKALPQSERGEVGQK